jgi:hypothetical protein
MLNRDKFIDLPDYGDHMTLEDFNDCVKCGGFIDYDGTGYYATKDKMNRAFVASPGAIMSGKKPPKWATHVMWFNR